VVVNNWAKRTPKNFKFTAKFPRVITHGKRLKHVDKELEQFFEAIGPLSVKILALLIQLPPSFQIHEGLQSLRELVMELYTRFRYAVEVRHSSWFQDLVYNFFADNDICMVWSQGIMYLYDFNSLCYVSTRDKCRWPHPSKDGNTQENVGKNGIY
jgi:uncharacterized protein YecE (DUF72 family)